MINRVQAPASGTAAARERLADSDASALANAAFVECEDVRDFLITHVRPVLERAVTGGASDATVHGAFLRVVGWMCSVGRLGDPMHFQGHVAAARAVFEVAVDLALLVRDRPNHPVDKVIAWERSAMLALAAKTAAHYRRTQAPVPQEHQERIEFAQRESAAIVELRRATWPHRKHPERHPSRWTGSDLAGDAKRADQLTRHGFDEFYQLRYPEWCWGTHGSGLAGIRPISAELFPGLAAMALRDAARFALIGGRLALEYFNKWDDIIAVRFERLDVQIRENRVRAFATQKGFFPKPSQ